MRLGASLSSSRYLPLILVCPTDAPVLPLSLLCFSGEMDKTAELVAVLRRSSQASRERTLLLLYALNARCGSESADRPDVITHLSLSSIVLILRYAFPGQSRRFLFTLGSNGAILRSPDRGLSWRCVYDTKPTTPSLPPEAKDNDFDAVTSLLSAVKDAEDDPTQSTNSSSSSPSVTCMAAAGSTVALGGERGFLVLSSDWGVTFKSFTTATRAAVGNDVTVEHIAVVSRGRLLFACGKQVFVADVKVNDTSASPAVHFGVVLNCRARVCHLHSQLCGSGVTETIVSEYGNVYLSYDSGQTFVAVPHSLGTVRCLEPLDMLRNRQQPALPRGPRLVQEVLGLAGVSDGKLKSTAYEYTAGRVLDERQCNTKFLSSVATCFMSDSTEPASPSSSSSSPSSSVYFRNYLATGVGTDVTPYDYSCVFVVGIRRAGDQLTVFSVGTKMNYIPFSRSSPDEPLLCAANRGVGGPSLVALRCGSCGVSCSTDLSKWSVPQKSAAVGVVAIDGGDVAVCGRRNVLYILGQTSATRTIPSSLRVPSLLGLSVL